MKHSEFIEKIPLYFYEELSGNDRILFEKHKSECEECGKIYRAEITFLQELDKDKSSAVDDRLLSSARYQLEKALRDKQLKAGDSNLNKIISYLFTPYKFAASLGIVLLIGLLTGYALFSGSSSGPINDYSNTQYISAANSFEFKDQDLRIASIYFIDADASDGEIEFEFDAIKPVRIKGSVNDPQIQAVLAYSMLNNQNPGSRLSSINAIDSKPQLNIDSETKNSLLTVMLTDDNPGVRLEALKVLKRLPYDEITKQAFLTVLASDTTSGLRIEAINALSGLAEKGMSLNQEEITLFKEKFYNDNNNYIKFRSRTILQEYN